MKSFIQKHIESQLSGDNKNENYGLILWSSWLSRKR